MCKDTVMLIVSISSILISIATFTIAYSQMKIASAKTRLDLYNKRFNVYSTAFDYYQATFYESHDKIKEKGNTFTQAFRESRFLFESTDGVYQTLEKIKDNGADIYGYEQRKQQTSESVELSTLHNCAVNARKELEENLLLLEQQIAKYIQFKTITGWSLLT